MIVFLQLLAPQKIAAQGNTPCFMKVPQTYYLEDLFFKGDCDDRN